MVGLKAERQSQWSYVKSMTMQQFYDHKACIYILERIGCILRMKRIILLLGGGVKSRNECIMLCMELLIVGSDPIPGDVFVGIKLFSRSAKNLRGGILKQYEYSKKHPCV